MIKIYPTTASGLTHSTYYVALKPRNGAPNLKRERPQANNITLSGETVVSVWDKKASGIVFSVQASPTTAEYNKLKLIDEHTTVFTWVIILQGRTFTATVDIIQAAPSNRQGSDTWDVSVKFTTIAELNK